VAGAALGNNVWLSSTGQTLSIILDDHFQIHGKKIIKKKIK
jgi:hypothetical protein